jgi:hypothetical protein
MVEPVVAPGSYLVAVSRLAGGAPVDLVRALPLPRVADGGADGGPRVVAVLVAVAVDDAAARTGPHPTRRGEGGNCWVSGGVI